MFIKPLPEYLLDWQIWEDVLCKDRSLFEEAKGVLLSYLWLISSQSDLKLAHNIGLLTSEIDWERWTSLAGLF